ncbi:MAG: hypothetical protein K8I30_24165, partial [Anaerolineae bacterium]|nr:hypothetical protein [Anaerolineae bacterium]
MYTQMFHFCAAFYGMLQTGKMDPQLETGENLTMAVMRLQQQQTHVSLTHKYPLICLLRCTLHSELCTSRGRQPSRFTAHATVANPRAKIRQRVIASPP